MRVIKPYGRSITRQPETSDGATPEARRQLKKRKDNNHISDVNQLAQDPDFVMAQWISMIDKIISKPRQQNKRTQVYKEQYNARERIGKAALHYIQLDDDQKRSWQWKLHPYDGKKFRDSKHKTSFKGRCYQTFVGDIEPKEIDETVAKNIADKINSHLHQHALRHSTMGVAKTTMPKGRIQHQLNAIARNVHGLKDSKDNAHIDDTAWQDYFSKDDVIAEIKNNFKTKYLKEADSKQTQHDKSADKKAKQTDPKANKLSDKAIIARNLYKHYEKVFGSDTKITELLDPNHPRHALWQVHSAIKQTYKALFDNASIIRKKKLHQHVPCNKEGMRRLIEQRSNNRNIAYLVRLGKVLHYTAADRGQTVRAAWEDDLKKETIAASPFWLSEGQAHIKRSEALVRVFKQAITYAAHTLSQLCQWQGSKYKDIYLNAKDAVNNIQDIPAMQQQLALLFGREIQQLFPNSGASTLHLNHQISCLLEQSIKAWAALRHSSFHFKGKAGFLQQLRTGLGGDGKQNHSFIEFDPVAVKLWQQDWKQRQQRIRDSLQAAHCEQYLSQQQLNDVYQAIAGEQGIRLGSLLDLPRLNRVLTRAQNTRQKQNTEGGQTLPAPAKRETLEQSSSLHCQYQLLKLLYEEDFSRWLHKKGTREISKWIKCAIERSEKAAREINSSGQSKQKMIHAKARQVWAQIEVNKSTNPTQEQTGPYINRFFDELAAATATEFRVQRFYESDSAQARQQAKFIDDLKCDVVAIALMKYLRGKWDWLLSGLDQDNGKTSSVEQIPTAESQQQSKPSLAIWQQRLYLLLHMVPVGVVSQLLHQLRKWQVLSTQHDADDQGLYEQCAQVMVLYLDMHDAKFDGGKNLFLSEKDKEQLKDCFENETVLKDCLPTTDDQANAHIPLRGLREMLRFGGAKALMPAFKANKITAAEYQKWCELQERIIDAQQQRQKIHEDYVKGKLSKEKVEKYQQAINLCSEHRHLTHRVCLIDHIQLHALLMAVLARLADYAGLWERDLYFVTLALCYQDGGDEQEDFKFMGEYGNYLDNGQIVKALRKAGNNGLVKKVDKLFRIKNTEITRYRNTLSHFNMLRPEEEGGEIDPINLTELVDQTRQLMAYDRKLKNAVSQSIIELLGREGLELQWKMNTDGSPHQLEMDDDSVKSKTIRHLKNKKIIDPAKGKQDKKKLILEQQHSDQYVQMVRQILKKNR